jgi:cob(I)alamin adenosyltransferase
MKNKKKHKNILYTGMGDKGTTTLFNCKQGRISKSANVIEALGAVDELNSFLGIIKVYTELDKLFLKTNNKKLFYSQIIERTQQNLFVVQAELAGSKMSVQRKEINYIENVIQAKSELLPPIKSFTLAGGSIVSSGLDYARTLARKAERRIIAVSDEGIKNVDLKTLAYINRLSSLLFTMSRYANYAFAIEEEHPKYNKK